MYRWRKPPILPSAYISAAFSSKRRMRAIWVSSRRASSASSRVRGGAVFVCAIGLSLAFVLPLLPSTSVLLFCASPGHCATLASAGGLPSQGAELVHREATTLAE